MTNRNNVSAMYVESIPFFHPYSKPPEDIAKLSRSNTAALILHIDNRELLAECASLAEKFLGSILDMIRMDLC